jgi:hypothetical protein
MQYALSRRETQSKAGKLEGKRELGISRRRWEDNIKIDLVQIG